MKIQNWLETVLFQTQSLCLGSPLIDGIFLVQKMCIYFCVTLSTILLMRAVQFNARSACDASQADRALNCTARINKVVAQE